MEEYQGFKAAKDEGYYKFVEDEVTHKAIENQREISKEATLKAIEE
jgi:hypothetical protein